MSDEALIGIAVLLFTFFAGFLAGVAAGLL